MWALPLLRVKGLMAGAGGKSGSGDRPILLAVYRRSSFNGLARRCIRSVKSRCSIAASSREFRGERKAPSPPMLLKLVAFLSGEFEWVNTPRLPPKLVLLVCAELETGAGATACAATPVLKRDRGVPMAANESEYLGRLVGVKSRELMELLAGVEPLLSGSICFR